MVDVNKYKHFYEVSFYIPGLSKHLTKFAWLLETPENFNKRGIIIHSYVPMKSLLSKLYAFRRHEVVETTRKKVKV